MRVGLRQSNRKVFENIRQGAQIHRLITGAVPYIETEPLRFMRVATDLKTGDDRVVTP